jgi:segregation and condensation protein B
MTKDKWGTNMVPPRLTLVKSEPESEEDAGLEAARVAAAEAEMRSLQAEEARVAELAAAERRQKLRILEAALFAASEPLDEARLLGHLTADAPVGELLSELQEEYAARGVNLVRVAGKWAFRTAEDLSYLLERYQSVERRLSKAALETLSIIAYHQPVTRAEVEEIRGVSTSAGTLDILLETGWVRPRGRRRAPGRPVTYGTTEAFLEHFGLDSIRDLPGLAELKGAGLLDSNLPPGFTVPEPSDVAALMPDELPLDAADEETAEEAEAAPEATPDLLDTDDNDKSEPSGA